MEIHTQCTDNNNLFSSSNAYYEENAECVCVWGGGSEQLWTTGSSGGNAPILYVRNVPTCRRATPCVLSTTDFTGGAQTPDGHLLDPSLPCLKQQALTRFSKIERAPVQKPTKRSTKN